MTLQDFEDDSMTLDDFEVAFEDLLEAKIANHIKANQLDSLGTRIKRIAWNGGYSTIARSISKKCFQEAERLRGEQ